MIALVAASTAIALTLPSAPVRPVHAGSLGAGIPAHCTEHRSFNGGADVPDDFRCAGLAIEYHTGGVARSPFPIWAGQWLFTDTAGEYRVGYCTLNRATHPTIAVPSEVVTQALPNDPAGRRTAYLAWKYGDTLDHLTAAALWAVFHYYAQDAAGTNRANNGTAPLVPDLGGVQAASGRVDMQAAALDLHAEAERFTADWALRVTVADGSTAAPTGVVLSVALHAGTTPVPGQEITVLVSGNDLPLVAVTGTDGTTTVAVPGSLSPGTVTVVATAHAPGPAVVYRGTPAAPDPHGAQYLVTAGDPVVLRAETTVDVAEPTTTTSTLPATTTLPSTTSTLPATTLPATTSTLPETTTLPATTVVPEQATTTSTTVLPTTAAPITPTSSAASPATLPRTGGGGDDSGLAYAGTAALVAGIGLVGTVRRRAAARPT